MIVNKTVLLIEDDVDDERLTLRALRKNNIMNEVIVACDGEEALDFVYQRGKFAGEDGDRLPSLVVLDLKLPRMSGLEVLRQLRENTRTALVPVVVMTSSEDPTQVSEAYEAGANSFVRKSPDPNEFSEIVLNVAMYWLLLNRAPQRA